MKLCKCGAIVEKRCERCYPSTHQRTTTERGYRSRRVAAKMQHSINVPEGKICRGGTRKQVYKNVEAMLSHEQQKVKAKGH